MSIKINPTSGFNCPIFVCDTCDGRIDDAYMANAVWKPNGEEVYFFHKGCDSHLDKPICWEQLSDFLIYLQNNTGFNRSKQGKAEEYLRSMYALGLAK